MACRAFKKTLDEPPSYLQSCVAHSAIWRWCSIAKIVEAATSSAITASSASSLVMRPSMGLSLRAGGSIKVNFGRLNAVGTATDGHFRLSSTSGQNGLKWEGGRLRAQSRGSTIADRQGTIGNAAPAAFRPIGPGGFR